MTLPNLSLYVELQMSNPPKPIGFTAKVADTNKVIGVVSREEVTRALDGWNAAERTGQLARDIRSALHVIEIGPEGLATAVSDDLKAKLEFFRAHDVAKEADAMHSLLLKRIELLMGCTEDSPEEAELKELADVVEAYEKKRWPIE